MMPEYPFCHIAPSDRFCDARRRGRVVSGVRASLSKQGGSGAVFEPIESSPVGPAPQPRAPQRARWRAHAHARQSCGTVGQCTLIPVAARGYGVPLRFFDYGALWDRLGHCCSLIPVHWQDIRNRYMCVRDARRTDMAELFDEMGLPDAG